MPSPFSSQETIRDAKNLTRNLGARLITLPIESLYRAYLEVLKSTFKGRKADIAEENIQARIRGNLLMALSNKFGWLILTTGNKSEMSVGYATLYGDMAGGFAVLKDVYKTLVYDLVAFRNGRKGLIPETIIKRAPTAELYPGQKDEDLLPPYSMLDRILQLYIEKDLSYEEIIKRNFRSQIVRDVICRVDRNEYKRRQSPPGIRISPKAFGKDRRMPITNAYRENETPKK
jgi:NAD+ synthase (glutamine-hydrolysing)